MNDCLFCQIVQKRIPAKIVHEDEHTLAFDDVNPQAPVHVLIIPKQHVQAVGDVRETESGLLAHLHQGRETQGPRAVRLPYRDQYRPRRGPNGVSPPSTCVRWTTHDLAAGMIVIVSRLTGFPCLC
jgi:hypothetical protein